VGLFDKIRDPISGIAQVVGCDAAPTAALGMPCRVQLVVQGAGIAPFSVDQTVEPPAGKWPTQGQSLPVTFDRNHTDRLRVEWDQIGAGATAAPASTPTAPTAPTPAMPDVGLTTPPVTTTTTSTVIGTSVGGAPMQYQQFGGAMPDQAKEAIARAEKMMNMDLDGDGTVAGAPAGPGQHMDLGKLMAQAQQQMAAFQQGGLAAMQTGAIPPPAAAPAQKDTIAQLEELAALRDRGALTDDEFEAQKKKILGGT
jgi:Short C-terminal domain